MKALLLVALAALPAAALTGCITTRSLEPCANLRITPIPPPPGAEGLVVFDVRFHNCSQEGVTLPAEECARHDGLRVELVSPGGRPWVLLPLAIPRGAEGAPARDPDLLDCPPAEGPPIHYPPGSSRGRPWAWDGRLADEPAPAGTYTLVATANATSGKSWQARHAFPHGLRDLVHGWSSGAERTVGVIDGAEEWQTLWERHLGNRGCPTPGDRSCLPPAPAVDFSRETVLAAWIGERGNGCYGARITEVAPEPNRTRVVITEYVPGPGLACTMALTQPHHAVAIPRDPRPIVFEERQEVRAGP